MVLNNFNHFDIQRNGFSLFSETDEGDHMVPLAVCHKSVPIPKFQVSLMRSQRTCVAGVGFAHFVCLLPSFRMLEVCKTCKTSCCRANRQDAAPVPS